MFALVAEPASKSLTLALAVADLLAAESVAVIKAVTTNLRQTEPPNRPAAVKLAANARNAITREVATTNVVRLIIFLRLEAAALTALLASANTQKSLVNAKSAMKQPASSCRIRGLARFAASFPSAHAVTPVRAKRLPQLKSAYRLTKTDLLTTQVLQDPLRANLHKASRRQPATKAPSTAATLKVFNAINTLTAVLAGFGFQAPVRPRVVSVDAATATTAELEGPVIRIRPLFLLTQELEHRSDKVT